MSEYEEGAKSLVTKLKALRETLTPEEQEAFGAMIELASKTARNLDELEKDIAEGESFDFLAAGILRKTQSSHSVFTREDLSILFGESLSEESNDK